MWTESWSVKRDFFQWNNKDIRCLVYTEDAVTKTSDLGLSNLKKKQRKVSNVNCCPVAFGQQIYVSLSLPWPRKSMKPNFYLRSLEKINPTQWYSTQFFGLNKIKQTVKEILKSVELDGFLYKALFKMHWDKTRLFYAGFGPIIS